MNKPVIYHIPVCPFSQRLEILLELKGCRENVEFRVVDMSRPRPDWLLELTRGTTAMPVLVTPGKQVIKESLVIMRYLDELFPDKTVAQTDPYLHAVEGMMEKLEGDFVFKGYSMVLNQDKAKRDEFETMMLQEYAKLNDFLLEHAPDQTFLFDKFGWAEAVFTPMFMRFWFLDYYEDFQLPGTESYTRVSKWRDACLSHPAAQQVSKEEIVKLYYDYAKGVGDAGLLPGRTVSSFAFEPHWKTRPMPPKDKFGYSATDEELGLI